MYPRTHTVLVLLTLASFAGNALAVEPAPLVNYQGVLRDAAEAPLTGSFDMTFRFHDTPVGGSEILVDAHRAGSGGAVAVQGGLFNVLLGQGAVSDGSGPGVYTSLDQVFADYADVWLEVQVGGETLAPRTRVVSAASALNASRLSGRSATSFLTTDPGLATSAGSLRLLGNGTSGLESYGSAWGGLFQDSDEPSTFAYAATGNTGLWGYGAGRGGTFYNQTTGATAYLAGAEDVSNPRYGIEALGTTDVNGFGGGGLFRDPSTTSRVVLAAGFYPLVATSNDGATAGVFSSYGALAYLANGNGGVGGECCSAGVDGRAYGAGGYFEDVLDGAWSYAARDTYKVYGNGGVSFVQNHPYEKNRVIVYGAPEGDEFAVYTRGSARLVKGVARVTLGATFPLVANPDIGLTVQLTPRGATRGLYVESVSTTEIVVREQDGGSGDVAFDFLVMGLRIGFEEVSIVQPKRNEAKIPSMRAHREIFAADPVLRRDTSLERFRAMRAGMAATDEEKAAPLDLSRANALKAAIGEFDPARDAADVRGLGAPELPAALRARREGQAAAAPSPVTPAAALASRGAPTAGRISPDAKLETPAREAAAMALALPQFPVAGRVEVGDLLALDPWRAGHVVRTTEIADPRVLGVAAEAAEDGSPVGVVLTGIATVKADATTLPIEPGMLLVAGPLAGHAMAATNAPSGTVVGKAIDRLDGGTGTIRVLLLAR